MVRPRSIATVRPTPERAADALRRRGFSLIDVLVSLAVVALLMTILLPTLASMHETARRVACGSNIRQIGLGTAMYSGDYDDLLPPSVFLRPESHDPARMNLLRIVDADRPGAGRASQNAPLQPIGKDWDGLGWLIGYNYIIAPKLFYCPSHHGEHQFDRYARSFGAILPEGSPSVVGNYHFRGVGPGGERRLSRIRPGGSALVADSLRSPDELNHREGTNILRADLAVTWYIDHEGQLVEALRQIGRGHAVFGATPETDPWGIVDRGTGAFGIGN